MGAECGGWRVRYAAPVPGAWEATIEGLSEPQSSALVELLSVCFAENADDRPRNAAALAEELTALEKGASSRTVAV